MAHGGKRQGAGRQEGSVNIPKLSAYYTSEQIEDFAANLMKRAQKSDRIAVFLAEHIWKKAPQPISNDEDKPFLVMNMSK